MAKQDHSAYQQKVIKRYYDNRDAIDDQRLAELVTNLYLSSGKKQEKMWETAEQIMTRMELPTNRITHVMESKDPTVLARVVEELQNGKLRKGRQKRKADGEPRARRERNPMTQPMTIVQLLPQLNAGGVERGTLEINRALVAAGHRSIVVSGGGSLVSQLESEGGQHVQMQIWKKSPSTLATVPSVQRWMREVQPDIMHARSRVPAWVTWLAWRKLPPQIRPRFMTTAHGMNRPNAYSRIMTYGERVIAVSHTCRDYLLKNYPQTDPNKVVVVHRGVAPEEFPYGYEPSAAWKHDWYQHYPHLRNQFVACVPGRVTRFKGHLDFVQAIYLLRQQGVTIHGVIAGGEDPRRKNYSAELRNRIAELGLQSQITFTGHRSDIMDVVAACDVTVSTSIHPPESFGRAVLESVRLGRITLGYAHGGVGEVLSTVYPEGKIPLQDVTTLALRLRECRAGRIAQPKPSRHFLLESMQKKELQIYKELIEPRVRLQESAA